MSTNLGRISPVGQDTRAAAMLAAGQFTVTIKSRVSGEHITIKATCKAKNAETQRWERVPFEQATHVFCEVPSSSWGDRVGTFRPQTGYFYEDSAADPKRVWAAIAALRYACKGTQHAQAEYAEADRCGRCGRELTDPESIARGIGPECYGMMTDSTHERRIWNAPGQQAPLPLKTPVAC